MDHDKHTININDGGWTKRRNRSEEGRTDPLNQPINQDDSISLTPLPCYFFSRHQIGPRLRSIASLVEDQTPYEYNDSSAFKRKVIGAANFLDSVR